MEERMQQFGLEMNSQKTRLIECGPLAAAFVLRGLKEFGEPTRKALIMDLAPEGRKAAMFELYYLVRDVLVAFAAFGGALLRRVSPELCLKVAFVFGVAGTLWFALRGSSRRS